VKSTTITAEGRRIRRWLIGVGLAIVSINLLNLGLRALRPTDAVSAPPGSTFGTNGEASGAWYELLDALGFRIARLEQPLASIRLGSGILDGDDTLAVIEPGFWQPDQGDLNRITEFLDAGGHLVLAGQMPIELTSAVFETPPTYAIFGPTLSGVLRRDALTVGIDTIVGSGQGAFDDPGSATALVGGDEHELVVSASYGRGTVVYLADASVLSNRFVGEADNAVLGVNLVRDRRVVFDEYVHGYGGEGFWAKLPDRWQTLLGLSAVALVVWLVAVGRRFGPPESIRRDLPPERRVYVDALGALMARARQPEAATAILTRASRRELERRTTSAGDSSDNDLATAALALGLDETEVDSLLGEGEPRGDEAALLVADRVLARLTGGPK
jgi:hypothetical protein